MDLPKIERTEREVVGRTSPSSGRPSANRRRPAAKTPPEKAREQDSLQWVTARLPPALLREIDAHAKRAGMTRSDSIRDCLAIGIETIRARDGVPSGRVDELLESLEGVRAAIDLVGPPTFGILRLLAHWATRDRALKVSEDELLAEVRAHGADEWEQALAEAESHLPEGPNAASLGPRD